MIIIGIAVLVVLLWGFGILVAEFFREARGPYVVDGELYAKEEREWLEAEYRDEENE